jgi:hypothetical protein
VNAGNTFSINPAVPGAAGNFNMKAGSVMSVMMMTYSVSGERLWLGPAVSRSAGVDYRRGVWLST